jgi:hypothetical protein
MNLWQSQREWLVSHGSTLLETHHLRTGRHLIDPSGDAEADAHRLFDAPFVVVSAGADDDQVLNYGNATALQLWEMDWDTFVTTPSRQTAEPVHRDERAEFLRQVREKGFIDDYSGIRISSSGNRFLIARATVWNVTDNLGRHLGQAATFFSWDPIAQEEAN